VEALSPRAARQIAHRSALRVDKQPAAPRPHPMTNPIPRSGPSVLPFVAEPTGVERVVGGAPAAPGAPAPAAPATPAPDGRAGLRGTDPAGALAARRADEDRLRQHLLRGQGVGAPVSGSISAPASAPPLGALGQFGAGALGPIVETVEGLGAFARAAWNDPRGTGGAVVAGVGQAISDPIGTVRGAVEGSAERIAEDWNQHPARGVGRALVEVGSVVTGGAFAARRGAQGLARLLPDRPAAPDVPSAPAAAGRVDAPAVPPRAGAAVPELPLSELPLGPRLGSGAHSAAHALDDGRVAVVLQGSRRGGAIDAATSDHLRGQIDYMHRAREVTFEGRPVAPRIDASIVDASGRTVGFVGERVPGRPLDELVQQGALTRAQLAEVRRQTEGQLDALHRAGLVQGDANGRNIMVDVGRDGRVTARFIDFEPPGPGFGPVDDAAVLRRNLDDAHAALAPERVAARRSEREGAARHAEVQARVDAARAGHAELRTELRALLRGLPEGARGPVEQLYDVVRMGGREARLLGADDFARAAGQLDALGAEAVLRRAGASDALLGTMRGVFGGWAR
jgi:hypothetical protein